MGGCPGGLKAILLGIYSSRLVGHIQQLSCWVYTAAMKARLHAPCPQQPSLAVLIWEGMDGLHGPLTAPTMVTARAAMLGTILSKQEAVYG
jgi:hypothetical protein